MSMAAPSIAEHTRCCTLGMRTAGMVVVGIQVSALLAIDLQMATTPGASGPPVWALLSLALLVAGGWLLLKGHLGALIGLTLLVQAGLVARESMVFTPSLPGFRWVLAVFGHTMVLTDLLHLLAYVAAMGLLLRRSPRWRSGSLFLLAAALNALLFWVQTSHPLLQELLGLSRPTILPEFLHEICRACLLQAGLYILPPTLLAWVTWRLAGEARAVAEL